MIDILSKENLLGMYKRGSELFKKATDNEATIVTSITPIEINDCRFRVTLYMRGSVNTDYSLEKVTLVAVTKQSEHYADVDTSKIHTKWLNSLGIAPTRTELYGSVYELGNIVISAEHDPRSGSDEIIITYLQSLSIRERNALYERINGYSWKDVQEIKHADISMIYWEGGFFTGKVEDKTRYYMYHGSPNRNDNYYLIVELSKDEYSSMLEKYSNSPLPKTNQDSTWAEIKKYVWEHPRRVFEGPNIL